MKAKREKGQIIVILALAIVALIGITAVAADGSMVYNERREDQSIADSVAMAGAGRAANYLKDQVVSENFCGKQLGTDVTIAALDGAYNFAHGSYNDDNGNPLSLEKNVADTENGILVSCGTDDIGRNYLDVTAIITSTTEPFFRQVITDEELKTSVRSTARVYPKKPFAWGNGLVTVSPQCKNKLGGMTFEGGAKVIVKNAGILSYSCITAEASNIHIESTGPQKSISYVPSSEYVGCKGCDASKFSPLPQPLSEAPPLITLDPPKCTNAAYVNAPQSGVLYPGNYYGITSKGDMELKPGLYCIDGGFSNDKGNFKGERVTLYFVSSATVKLNDNSNKGNYLILTAPDCETADPNCGVPPAVRGLLMYSTQPLTIQINGNSANVFEGTIYAPSSDATLNGGSTTSTIKTQIIVSFIKVTGGALLEMNLEGAELYQEPAQIELLR